MSKSNTCKRSCIGLDSTPTQNAVQFHIDPERVFHFKPKTIPISKFKYRDVVVINNNGLFPMSEK